MKDETYVENRIHTSIRMLIPARKRKEARSILGSMVERTKLAEGCLVCRLYQDALEAQALMFEAVWADEYSLKKHLRSDEFRTVLLMVEMASAPPEIHFNRIARSTGIQAIEQMQGDSVDPGSENNVAQP